MLIVERDRIEQILAATDVVPAIAEGFVAYSEKRAVVPPVGELVFENPPGVVHIKYGYLEGDSSYVIKIASGFYENPARGLPTSTGMMLLYDKETGQPQGIFLDGGVMTATRTAAAGAIVAKHLAPKAVRRIGIVGAGNQGRMQLEYLGRVVACRDVIVWGTTNAEMTAYKAAMCAKGFEVRTTSDIAEVGATCDLIVTTTPSRKPLLLDEHVKPGSHVTAVGSDTPEKQEVAAAVLGRADIVVADSIEQCMSRGEIYQAIAAGTLDREGVTELGDILRGVARGRTSDDQTTVADLTGVAVQDIQICKAVYEAASRVDA